MFFKAWTVHAQGIKEGMPITSMVKAMQDMERKQPGITIDELPSSLCVYRPSGLGDAVSVRVDGQDGELEFDQRDIAWVPAPARVFFQFKEGQDCTLLVAPNGSASVLPGIDTAAPFVPIPEGAPPLVANAARWLATGDVGASSQFMCATIAGLGGNPRGGHPHPLDTSDLGRCLEFLKAVPEARASLGKMKDASPQWSALVDRWEELETAMREDRPRASALLDEILGRPDLRRKTGPR